MFELGACSGTLMGFWTPGYLGSGLNVPGFHLHFLSGTAPWLLPSCPGWAGPLPWEFALAGDDLSCC